MEGNPHIAMPMGIAIYLPGIAGIGGCDSSLTRACECSSRYSLLFSKYYSKEACVKHGRAGPEKRIVFPYAHALIVLKAHGDLG